MTSYTTDDPQRLRNRARARKVKARGVFDTKDVEARIDAQEARCHYCDEELDFDGPNKWQVDHFIPLSRGGSNWASNIVIACGGCNSSKGDKMPWEFRPARFEEGGGRDD